MKQNFLVIDCNNFFVSCERAFNPSLEGRPVVVLSSNDGCCVSRSEEAKALGIPMGIPLFKIKDLVSRHKVAVFSSNFELYGDISGRIMRILASFFPEVEHYSVDEAFIPITYRTAREYEEVAQTVKAAIYKQTGIPVSIGIAPTRTLAKAANDIVKKWAVFDGVFSFLDLPPEKSQYYLSKIAVEDIWGIGYKSASKLQARKVFSALDFVQMDELLVKKYLKVTGVRTRLELLGKPSILFSELRAVKKGICCSRSFGKRVLEKKELAEAVACYVDSACSTLRKQGSVAQAMTVYIRTSHFASQDQKYCGSRTIMLPIPSSYTPLFIKEAMKILDQVYKANIKYAKAGVFLTSITSGAALPQHLFNDQLNTSPLLHNKITTSIDALRKRYGKYSVRFGSMGVRADWKSLCNQRSQRYTTQVSELLSVN